MPLLRLALAFFLAFSSGWLRSMAQPAGVVATGVSQTGTLPNGMRYVVLPHTSPKDDISLRLIVQAGSLDERDDERGFAHFVEHMAFNGTRHHPAGTLRQLFQTLGLSFGADLNANTSYTHTNYLLSLPKGRADLLDQSIGLLRDYADGQLFLPEEVKQESAVVVSELNARDSASRRVSKQFLNALYAGTRVPERDVIGLVEQLETATPDQLRAFYQRNYLAHRMTVLVVGPVDPAVVVQKITAAFESLATPSQKTPAAPTPDPARLDGVKAEVIAIPTSKGTNFQLSYIGNRRPDTVEGRREELIQRIATAALSTRLQARRESGDSSRFGPPRVNYQPTPFGSLVQSIIELGCTTTSWPEGIQLVETELRRLQTGGFTAAEVAEASAGQLTYARNRASQIAGQPAASLAVEVGRQLAGDRMWQSPAEQLAETVTTLEGLKPEEVTAAVAEVFPPDSRRLILTVPPGTTVTAQQLLTAYNKSAARTIKAMATKDEALKFRYDNFGAPGKVAKREQLEDLQVTLVSFENGVRLNVRPTTFSPDRFSLRVVFRSNFSDLPANRGGISDLAGHVMLNSSLRRHPLTEIIRLMKLRGVSAGFDVNNGTPILSISGPETELPFALQFLTAILSDLQFDQEHYRNALSRYNGLHNSARNTPSTLALRSGLYAYTNDRRVILQSPQLFRNDTGMDETVVWLRNYVLNAALEIGIVGRVVTDDVIANAAATVGTLKRRRPSKPGNPLASPVKAIRQEGTAELPASTSMSCVLWPITLPDEPKANAALSFATDVLRERLLVVLRETLGATYSPSTRIFRDAVQRDFAYVAMVNTFTPAASRQLTLSSLGIAAQLAAQGIRPEEFARMREPARTQREQNVRNNGWWLSHVAVAQSRPEVLEEMRQYEKIINEITIEDVNLAAKVFKPDRSVSTVMHPASAKVPLEEKAKKKKGSARQ